MSQRHIQLYRQNFSEFCRIHLKFLLLFQIPYIASIFYVFLLHLSGSTGSLRPLLDTGWYSGLHPKQGYRTILVPT
jgi:hypothetical protein